MSSSLENLIGAMTLAELARFANTTVENVVAAALEGAAQRPAKPNGTSSSPNGTRTSQGKVGRAGVRMDQLLSALSRAEGPTTLKEVQSHVGGSAAQVRAALQKLRDAGKLRITGERRGTRYVLR